MGEIVVTATTKTVNQIYVGGRSRPSSTYNPSKKRGKRSAVSVPSWWNGPEMKRQTRVAKYKYYSYEGKVKASLKKGFRWIKCSCTKLVRRF